MKCLIKNRILFFGSVFVGLCCSLLCSLFISPSASAAAPVVAEFTRNEFFSAGDIFPDCDQECISSHSILKTEFIGTSYPNSFDSSLSNVIVYLNDSTSKYISIPMLSNYPVWYFEYDNTLTGYRFLKNVFPSTGSWTSVRFTLLEGFNCPECEECQECETCPPSTGGGGDYSGVIHAIYICGAAVIVSLFFYLILKMFMGVRR